MRNLVIALLLSFSATARGAVLAVSSTGDSVAAGGGRILINRSGAERSLPGPANPTAAWIGHGGTALVIDALDGSAIVITNSAEPIEQKLRATITDALLLEDAALLLLRESAEVVRIGFDGSISRTKTAAGPLAIRKEGDAFWVYASAAGTLEKFDDRLRSVATHKVPPFASDLEIGSGRAYLPIPRKGLVAVVRLSDGRVAHWQGGAVPIDIEIRRAATAATSDTLFIADPASRKVWQEEGDQSVAAAFGRGFLRGFLGFSSGGRGVKSSEPVDRIAVAGRRLYGYDTSSRRLYVFDKGAQRLIGSKVAPFSWSVSSRGAFVVDGTNLTVRQLR